MRPFVSIDPRTKFLLFIAANIALWSGVNYILEGVLFILIWLMLMNGKLYQLACLSVMFFVSSMALDIFFSPLANGFIGVVFLTLVRISRIYMPIVLASLVLIRTTTVSEFVAAFRKMHIPQAIIIPFSVMFRFFPTLSEEWLNIQRAMRFRGIDLKLSSFLKSPMKTLEYTVVPLLMSSTKIAHELSAASISRGLGGKQNRTCFQTVSFGKTDMLLTICLVSYCVCIMFI